MVRQQRETAAIRRYRRRGRTLKDSMISNELKERYQTALVQITEFWMDHNVDVHSLDVLDESVSTYLEHIFAEGLPKSLASDTLASIQHHLPTSCGKLRFSWKMAKTWQKLEPPTRLVPLSPLVVQAFAGGLWQSGYSREAAALLVAFDAMLRPGELYQLRCKDITFYDQAAVITLRDTKTGQRKGSDEMVVIESQLACNILRRAVRAVPRSNLLLSVSPYRFRFLFRKLVSRFQLRGSVGMYSLRRGGATFDFLLHKSMERTLLRGRWASSSTARIYLQHTVASISELALTKIQRIHLAKAAKALHAFNLSAQPV